MTNIFLLHIKLLAVDPATGKSFAPPCTIEPQLLVNLHDYLETVVRSEEHNSEAYENAIEEILSKIQGAFAMPLGWLIEMQSFDEFFAHENPFYKPEVRRSAEFFYSPGHEQTAVEVEFMWDWAVETVTRRHTAAEGN